MNETLKILKERRSIRSFRPEPVREEELNAMVDQGCTVLDVTVEHPVYGQLTGQLQISSRYDVEQFLARVQAHDAAPLSMLTGGIHLHTLRCPDEAACERACAALKAAGLLLDD